MHIQLVQLIEFPLYDMIMIFVRSPMPTPCGISNTKLTIRQQCLIITALKLDLH